MNQAETLKDEVIALSRLYRQIEDAGGPETEGSLFEDYLEARVRILAQFGLPEAEEFLFLLATGDVLTPDEAEQVIAELHEAATQYLLSPVRREEQVLEEARAEKQNPFNVLPELGIITHSFTLFVYDAVLLKNRDTVENVWQCLKMTKQPPIIEALGTLYADGQSRDETAFRFLQSCELPYLDEFIAMLPTIKQADALS